MGRWVEFETPLMRGRLNMAQIMLACALLYAAQILGLGFRPTHPKLASWLDAMAKRPSIAATGAEVRSQS